VLITVNGVFNLPSQANALNATISKAPAFQGAQPVKAVNITTYIGDLVQIVGDELGLIQIDSTRLANNVNSIYRQLKTQCSCAKIQIVAHSQGAMVVNRALPLIQPEARKLVYIYTFGGETTIQGAQGLAGEWNYKAWNSWYENDPITLANYLPAHIKDRIQYGKPQWDDEPAPNASLFEHPFDANYSQILKTIPTPPPIPIR
jgi:hypothetical protein